MNDFLRSYRLEDISIRSDGDGRTVEALAATFDQPYRVSDRDGVYEEVIERSAFNKTLADNGLRFGVFYNHGMDLYGGPSDRYAMPLGTPVELRADARGLVTVTRYARTEVADEVLELIRSGAITAQSFSGRFVHSDPKRAPRGGFRPGEDGALRTVRRLEVSLREYGPTPFPANPGALVHSVRQTLLAPTHDGPDARADTSTPEAVTEADVEPLEHSSRQTKANHLRLCKRAREDGGPLS